MKSPQFRLLATLSIHLEPAHLLGDTPEGHRKIVPVRGGVVAGPRLSGVVLPGGGDWARTTIDGVLHLDVRLTMQTNDNALIYVRYSGVRHGPDDVMSALARGETVGPDKMYFRIQPRFETADERYGWLNKILSVGIGERLPDGPQYRLFELL